VCSLTYSPWAVANGRYRNGPLLDTYHLSWMHERSTFDWICISLTRSCCIYACFQHSKNNDIQVVKDFLLGPESSCIYVYIRAARPSRQAALGIINMARQLFSRTAILGLAARALAGSPATCLNPQLSCHNTTVVEDLCCFNAPGGQLLQTQFWDTAPVTGPVDSWTIHGLWCVFPLRRTSYFLSERAVR